MDGSLVIDLPALRATLAGALDACEAQLGTRVPVEINYYWHLPVDAAFDMTSEPSGLTVGQLSDDIQEVSSGLVGPETAWHDLAHAIGVLRALEARIRP